jgi:hypothetical protein
MVDPIPEGQQQSRLPHQSRLLIRRLWGLRKERMVNKRWEFQHTAFDPLKLWNTS